MTKNNTVSKSKSSKNLEKINDDSLRGWDYLVIFIVSSPGWLIAVLVVMTTPHMSNKRKWKIISLGTLLLVMWFTLISAISSTRTSSYDLRADLEAQAVTENKDTPQKVDDVTVFTGASAEDKTITYQYTVSSSFDENQLKLDEIIKDPAVENHCSDQSTRFLLDKGAVIKHKYLHGKSGSVYTVLISKSDCI